MKRINLIFILNLLLSFQVRAEIIEFYDYTGTHLAYELNSETKEAKVGIYKGFSDGNPHSTAPCIHWQDKNDYTDYFRNLIIPNTIEYEGIYYTITSIAPYAFCEDTRVETIKLPETISTIGANAFYFCVNLTSINLPNAVTAINKQTFEQCTKLKINSLGKNITKIDSRAFFDCHSITELNIPGKCEVIENDAFSWCKGLKKLIIEDSNTILSLGYSYSLSLHYQGQDKASYRGAFADCPIEELYMGRNISFPVSTNKSYPPFTGISNYCTNTTGYQGPTGKTLKKLQFGESVTNLPNQLFYKSSLQCDIILPPYIETIGDECFNLSFFNNQVEITFPKTLKSVGNKWYDTSDHDKIKFINCEGEIPASGNFSGYVVYVPSGAGDIYKNSDSWKNSCIIDPSDKLISINVKTAGTLYSRILAQDVQISDVTRLKLKGTLNNDDWNVIKTMNNIHELDLLEISNDLFPTDYFKNWSFITKIILPKNLSSIGDYMFYGCSHLNCIIEIHQNCKKIG